MRLLISQCSWCNRDKASCGYANAIRKKTSEIKFKGTLAHNCPVYRTALKEGTLVEVELKEIIVDEYDDYEGGFGINFEWESIGWAKGYILGMNGKRFYIIYLLEPAKLVLPEKGNIQNAKEVEVQIRLKQLKDIKVLAEPDENWEQKKKEINGW